MSENRTIIVDLGATASRKPRAGPLVDPDEAIAIALSTVEGRLHSPEGRAVQMVLLALKSAGWQIVPR